MSILQPLNENGVRNSFIFKGTRKNKKYFKKLLGNRIPEEENPKKNRRGATLGCLSLTDLFVFSLTLKRISLIVIDVL